jgi:hypothetical protein
MNFWLAVGVAEKDIVNEPVPVAEIHHWIAPGLPPKGVITQYGAVAYEVAKVTVHVVGLPVPKVTVPLVSFPVIEGEVPQVVTVAAPPEFAMWPDTSNVAVGAEFPIPTLPPVLGTMRA